MFRGLAIATTANLAPNRTMKTTGTEDKLKVTATDKLRLQMYFESEAVTMMKIFPA
jgi:hypothetical protein